MFIFGQEKGRVFQYRKCDSKKLSGQWTMTHFRLIACSMKHLYLTYLSQSKENTMRMLITQ